jgi:hypothetical protein
MIKIDVPEQKHAHNRIKQHLCMNIKSKSSIDLYLQEASRQAAATIL